MIWNGSILSIIFRLLTVKLPYSRVILVPDLDYIAEQLDWFVKVMFLFPGNLRGPNVGVTSPDSAGESKSVCSLQSNNSRCSHWIWRMENQPGVYNGGCTTTERPRTRREASDGRQEASQASWSQASARPGPEVHGLLVFEKPFKV